MGLDISGWFLGLRLQTISSRRAFLASCGSLPILAMAHRWQDLFSRELKGQETNAHATLPRQDDRALLQLVMDEMIPAGDGMPSASEAGALTYLNLLTLQDPQIEAQLKESLGTLQSLSIKRYAVDFPRLSPSLRVRVLSEMEKTPAPQDFEALKNYVYEAYYTQPRVLGLLVCRADAAEVGDDFSLLAPVRAMSSFYRQVQ